MLDTVLLQILHIHLHLYQAIFKHVFAINEHRLFCSCCCCCCSTVARTPASHEHPLFGSCPFQMLYSIYPIYTNCTNLSSYKLVQQACVRSNVMHTTAGATAGTANNCPGQLPFSLAICAVAASAHASMCFTEPGSSNKRERQQRQP